MTPNDISLFVLGIFAVIAIVFLIVGDKILLWLNHTPREKVHR